MPDHDSLPIHCFTPYLPLKGFKAYKTECCGNTVSCERKDVYKLCLISRRGVQEIAAMDENNLFFVSPQSAYLWKEISGNGYVCLFTEDFLSKHLYLKNFLLSPLSGLGDMAFYHLNQLQYKHIAAIFQQILFAQNSGYIFKHELITSYLCLVIHEALKIRSFEGE